MRYIYISIGWGFVLLGLIGVFLPVLPTTIFMILALWAFAKSSPRFHDWLYHHKLFGPPLQTWAKYHVIPPYAKWASVSMMSVSFGYLLFFAEVPVYVLAIAFAIIAYGAWYILTKPSFVPVEKVPVENLAEESELVEGVSRQGVQVDAVPKKNASEEK